MLLFQLKCRQFIEVLSGHDTLTPSSPDEDFVMDTEHTITVEEESTAGECYGHTVCTLLPL